MGQLRVAINGALLMFLAT